jgi:hypothetical protein
VLALELELDHRRPVLDNDLSDLELAVRVGAEVQLDRRQRRLNVASLGHVDRLILRGYSADQPDSQCWRGSASFSNLGRRQASRPTRGFRRPAASTRPWSITASRSGHAQHLARAVQARCQRRQPDRNDR